MTATAFALRAPASRRNHVSSCNASSKAQIELPRRDQRRLRRA